MLAKQLIHRSVESQTKQQEKIHVSLHRNGAIFPGFLIKDFSEQKKDSKFIATGLTALPAGVKSQCRPGQYHPGCASVAEGRALGALEVARSVYAWGGRGGI